MDTMIAAADTIGQTPEMRSDAARVGSLGLFVPVFRVAS